MLVTTVGASSGVILTPAALARLRVKKGDTLYLAEARDCAHRLTPYDPTFARQMALAEEIMVRDVVPNIMAPIIIIFSINIGGVIIAEASLSFLGFGLPVQVPSWEGMLSGEGTCSTRG